MNMKFKPRIVFFDIDETLYINRDEQRVPESAKTALRLLKQKGIITAIATGRTIAVLPAPIRDLIDECGIDLIVSVNGQYVQYRGEKWVSFPMPQAALAQHSGSLHQAQVAHAFVAHEGLFTAREDAHSQAALSALGLPYTLSPDAHQTHEIYQLLAFYTSERDGEVAALMPDDMKVIRWHEHGTDWLDKAGSKARGIEAALAKLGLTLADAMAFGDAHNDCEMLQAVGFGVAMGNAEPEIKAIADYVCPPIDEDGIYRGLVDLGVIDAVL